MPTGVFGTWVESSLAGQTTELRGGLGGDVSGVAEVGGVGDAGDVDLVGEEVDDSLGGGLEQIDGGHSSSFHTACYGCVRAVYSGIQRARRFADGKCSRSNFAFQGCLETILK